VSKKPQKTPPQELFGRFVVIAATDVVKNKTARKSFPPVIYSIKVNKIKLIDEFLCGWNFLPDFETASSPIWE
jgi:hypothetical protein